MIQKITHYVLQRLEVSSTGIGLVKQQDMEIWCPGKTTGYINMVPYLSKYLIKYVFGVQIPSGDQYVRLPKYSYCEN